MPRELPSCNFRVTAQEGRLGSPPGPCPECVVPPKDPNMSRVAVVMHKACYNIIVTMLVAFFWALHIALC